MPPFSSFFDFVSHHNDRQQHIVTDDEMDMSTSSSSSDRSTFTALTSSMKSPLSPTTTKSERRKVSFFNSVKVQLIESLEEYTAEEKSSCWFNRREFEEMKRDRRATVKVMESGDRTVDDARHYFRGLEYKTRRGLQRKQWNIVESSTVVFDEQMHQVNTMGSVVDDETISKAYRSATAHSAAAAIERGLFDRKAALDCNTPISSMDVDDDNSVDIAPQMPPRRLSLSCHAA
jgi:hypothetical protein